MHSAFFTIWAIIAWSWAGLGTPPSGTSRLQVVVAETARRGVLIDVGTSAEADALTPKNWVRKAWLAVGAHAGCVVQLHLVELLVGLAE